MYSLNGTRNNYAKLVLTAELMNEETHIVENCRSKNKTDLSFRGR